MRHGDPRRSVAHEMLDDELEMIACVAAMMMMMMMTLGVF
jgi:hypothetical protein